MSKDANLKKCAEPGCVHQIPEYRVSDLCGDHIPLYIVSAARKVVFGVGSGPVVTFPEGATINSYGKGNENPVVVVKNDTDGGTWQGAHPGQFVILNEVPEDIAHSMLNIYELGGKSNTAILEACDYARSMGCGDQYTTDPDFYSKKLSPAGRMVGQSGIVKRDDRDLIPCFQRKGLIYVCPQKKSDPKRIEQDILLRTYRMPDGSQIDLSNIPERGK